MTFKTDSGTALRFHKKWANEIKISPQSKLLLFGSLGGIPSPRVRGLEGKVSQESLVGLEPKFGVLNPSLFGPKP